MEDLSYAVRQRLTLLAQQTQRLDEIMLKDPFYLAPDMSLTDAMRAVLIRHYPVYPVCENPGYSSDWCAVRCCLKRRPSS
jgi:magnesium transporter